MAKGKTSGSKPTGPNSKLQGKPLGVHYSQPRKGPVDTANSSGQWDANARVVTAVRQNVSKGSKKSF